MIISPPFLPAAGAASGSTDVIDPMMDAVDKFELAHGIYPIAFDRRWHTGVHLMPDTQNERVRAIADGEVVAYRVCQKAIDGGGGALDSNAGFVLLKHVTDTGDGRSITFYSLYMHLLDLGSYTNPQLRSLPDFLQTATPDEGQSGGGKKVYRKDVLGLPGACHAMRHVHFEIFMLPADFTAYFGSTQLDNKQPATPSDTDYWGHTYYIIPAGQSFLARPTGVDQHGKLHGIPFDALQDGSNQSALHVETYFLKGDRYTSTWSVAADGTRTLLTPQPVKEAGYEYALYSRATALYPQCPSDGYELLRFGRILSPNPTLQDGGASTPVSVAPSVSGNPHPIAQANPRTTWLRITYAQGQEGYIDINGSSIVKLSDADFPFFTGWTKITEQNTPFQNDGMCDVDALTKIVSSVMPPAVNGKDNEYQDEDALCNYILANDAVRQMLRGFICEAPTEWDSSHNDTRYAKLNDADGFYGKQKDTNPTGYNDFLTLLKKFQFWDKTGLPDGKLWFFHPLQFIRHFRKCGWLRAEEMAQCFPPTLLRLYHTDFVTDKTSWSTAFSRATDWVGAFNRGARKYGVNSNKLRLLHLFSHVIPETGSLSLVVEVGAEGASYAPYYGRGLIQLTGLDNYSKYGEFRKFHGNAVPQKYSGLGWNPDEIIAKDNKGNRNDENCVDSACFYIVKRNGMLQHMDAGCGQEQATIVSKDVNGYVDIQNLNGLDLRLQAVMYLRNIMLDEIFDSATVTITFDWRRNSKKEPKVDAEGHTVTHGTPPKPVMIFYKKTQTIQASLSRQQP